MGFGVSNLGKNLYQQEIDFHGMSESTAHMKITYFTSPAFLVGDLFPFYLLMLFSHDENGKLIKCNKR